MLSNSDGLGEPDMGDRTLAQRERNDGTTWATATAPASPATKANPGIQLLPDKVLIELKKYCVSITDPNAVVKALTIGEKGDSRVPDDVKRELVRGCVRDNTDAVKIHQEFREELLMQLEVADAEIEQLCPRDTTLCGGDLKRAVIFNKLQKHTFEAPEEGMRPNFQTWNRDQLMEALNVFRTLGMHDGVVQLFQDAQTYYAQHGQPSPWNADAQHLYAYALNRTENSPRARQEMVRVILDKLQSPETSRAGPLAFAGLAEFCTKNARGIERVIDKVKQGKAIASPETDLVVDAIQSLSTEDIAQVFARFEQVARASNKAELVSLSEEIQRQVNETKEEPNSKRVKAVLEGLQHTPEVLEEVRELVLNIALIASRQALLGTGSPYAGLHYLRRVAEKEIEITKKVQAGFASEEVNKELVKLKRLRQHLPILINNATIAVGGAHPVLVWNRGDILETGIMRGLDQDRVQRDLEKLLLAVEREAEPLKNNPLYRVPGVAGPGWKLGMVMRRIETYRDLTREQLELAQDGVKSFGTVEELSARLNVTENILEQLYSRVELYERTGMVLSPKEKLEIVQKHQNTETPGEALSRWTYTLREATSSPLPAEIPGSAKMRGGLIPSYTTNQADCERGYEILRSIGVMGPLTESTIARIQRYIRSRFQTSELMSPTNEAHHRYFDLPQDLIFLVGGGGDTKLREGLGCQTSLFSAVDMTPGDCRGHANLFGGFSDLQLIHAYRELSRDATLALLDDKMEDFARITGQQIPALLQKEISQSTLEMMVTADVKGTYQFPRGKSQVTATFVERTWSPGEALTPHELQTGILVATGANGKKRVLRARESTEFTLEQGETVVLASKAEEHTINNQVIYGLKSAFGVSEAGIEGIKILEVDIDSVQEYRARCAFYNRDYVEPHAQPDKQSLYDLGNCKLGIVDWCQVGTERMPVLDGGPINVESSAGDIIQGRVYMIPRMYSKNPIMPDSLMSAAIKVFGMDAPHLIRNLDPAVARSWYDSWIDKIDDLKQ
jgi:hypothetical protein